MGLEYRRNLLMKIRKFLIKPILSSNLPFFSNNGEFFYNLENLLF